MSDFEPRTTRRTAEAFTLAYAARMAAYADADDPVGAELFAWLMAADRRPLGDGFGGYVWASPNNSLDYHHYLPRALCEPDGPYVTWRALDALLDRTLTRWRALTPVIRARITGYKTARG